MSEKQKSFTESTLWNKVAKTTKSAGRALIEQVVVLTYTLKDSDTPIWARGTILSALAYFVSPLDIIPDFMPMAGYSDDLTAIAAAIAAVAVYIKKEHRIAAREKTDKWFGPRSDASTDIKPV